MRNILSIIVLCLGTGIACNVAYSQNGKPLKKITKNYFVMPDGITEQDYIPNTIIFKVKAEFRKQCTNENINISALQDVLNDIGGKELHKKFPRHTPPEQITNKTGQKLADLSLIYQLKYESNTSIEDAINMLYNAGVLEYACLKVTTKPLYTPNDTYAVQYNLTNIKAYEAWDIEKGDTNVVIGITDTGFELTHDDLGGIKYNYSDPIDGSDNDNDGYIDNFQGWDFAMGDNDPTYLTHSHGVSVTGVACGTPDNSVGVAGVGFNCKYLPVKIMDDLTNTLQVNEYEAIVYAADHGCKVINCSWGGTITPGSYGQDVITYAVINKDAVVVASVGNNGNMDVFYPASYDYVISVGNIKSDDTKSGGSCYGYYVDLFASALSIYTTAPGNTYTTASASSYTAPQVSGAAALLRSHFPNYSALQIGQLLKSSADVIDTLSGNSSYVGLMGAGRLNIYKALTDSTSPGIKMVSQSITDGNDENYYTNDTLSISAEFANYLAPTSNLTVTLSTNNPNVSILNSSVNIGAVGTLSVANNSSNPFKIKLLTGASINEEIALQVTYTDGVYTSFEYIVFRINQNYLNIVPNQISTTLTGNGRIGFNGTAQSGGMGLNYKSTALVYASSFMIGNSASQVSDGMYGVTVSMDGIYDNDFSNLDPITEVIPSVYADNDYYTKFNDDSATSKLNVEVSQRTFAWDETGYDDFIIVEYDITNKSGSTLSNLYAGIFTDWDILYYTLNAAHVDTAYNIGYAKSLTHNSYAGIHLISGGDFISYAIDMNEMNGSVGYYNDLGFSGTDKFTMLSTMRDSAGYTGYTYGEEIGNSVSAGPFSLNANESKKIAFAIMVGGESLNDLRDIATMADFKYELMYAPVIDLSKGTVNVSCYGLCDGEGEFPMIGGAAPITYQWNDANNQTTAQATGLCAGLYTFIATDANGYTDSITVGINEPDSITASFSVNQSSSQSACDGSVNITVSGGTGFYSYLWNDSLSQTDSVATGLCVGEYAVMVTDENGCEFYDTVQVSFTTSVNELNINPGINTYYPNPTSGKLTILLNVEKTGNYEMNIYNVTGEKVFDIMNGKLSEQGYQYTFDLSTLPEGVYFIQLTSDETSQAQKLLIAK